MKNLLDFKKRVAGHLGGLVELEFSELTKFKKKPYCDRYPEGRTEVKNLGEHKIKGVDKVAFILEQGDEQSVFYWERNSKWEFPDENTAIYKFKYNLAKFEGYYTFKFRFID